MAENETSVESKQSFLFAAIEDIGNNIKFLDTKIALIMATAGVFAGAVAAGLYSLSEVLAAQSSALPNWLRCNLNNCVVLFGVAIVMVFAFGIHTITPRYKKPSKPSLWFISDTSMNYETYEEQMRSLTDAVIIDNLASQLYSLNIINAKKMKATKKTMWAFAGASILAGLILFVVLIYTMLF